ncbi:MAG: FAD-binding oxidoreductase [Deltaproteobacteria bacterium]|nr:FAD-binding oxidoreductase [Deltaproteobacteria bacterium]
MAESEAIDGVVPRSVVEPATIEEVAAAIRDAAERDLAVVPRGLGGHLDVGGPPRRADMLLSMRSVSRIVDHQAADMTVRVEAGCPLSRLASTLAGAGQWLPLDPPGSEATTVGGLLATNLAGPLRASQGTARDLLIGLTVVAHDGALVSGGGRVVKNVAGYDMPKMHVGALGTLGVIVEATFKVRPRPALEAAIAMACASPEEAGDLALALRDACEPLWLEIVGPDPAGSSGDLGFGESWSVVAGAGGVTEEVRDALARYAETGGARVLETEVPEAAELRARIADRTLHPLGATIRAATLPTRVGAFLGKLSRSAATRGVSCRVHAHAANGVVRARLDGGESLGALVADVRAEVENEGGNLVVERAPPGVKRTLAAWPGIWGDPGPGLGLMKRIKSTFDPADRLSPGRFVC